MVRFAVSTEEPNNIIDIQVNGLAVTEPEKIIFVPKGSTVIVSSAAGSSNNFCAYHGNSDYTSRYLGNSGINSTTSRHEMFFIAEKDYNHCLISNIDKGLKTYDVYITSYPDLETIISGTYDALSMTPTRFNPDSNGRLYLEDIDMGYDWYMYRKNADNSYTYHFTLYRGLSSLSSFPEGTYHLTTHSTLDPNWRP